MSTPANPSPVLSMDEARLRRLFAKRDKLVAELAATDRAIAAAGRVYWSARGVRIVPRVERLRHAVMGGEQ